MQNAKTLAPAGDPNSILRSFNLSLVTLVTQRSRETRTWFNCLQETKQHWDKASRSADWTSRISFWEQRVNVHLLLGLTAVLKQIQRSKISQTLSVWFWRQTNSLCLLGRRRYTSCWNLFVMQWLNIDVQSSAITVYVMHQQFNIQQLYALPTLYLCVLYLSENKQRLVPLTA